ncbi:MAG: nucleotidyltransferase family protein [Candidatus Rokuibacteriota bacterium]
MTAPTQADRSRDREHQALLLCARTPVGPAVLQAMADLLAGDIDWTYLVRIALSHQVVPLLDRCLQPIGDPPVPADLLYALRVRVEQNRRRNEELAAALRECMDDLDGAGVAAVALDGPVVASLAYGSLDLREARDPGILVRPADLPALLEVLQARGYRRVEPGQRLSAAQDAAFRRFQVSHRYVRATDQIGVEPHWAIAPWSAALDIDMERLWRRAIVADGDRGAVRRLALDDLVLVLSVQGGAEQWRCLRTICDLAHLIGRHPELHLGDTLEAARVQGCGPMVALGLALAHRVAGTELPLPEPVLRRVEPLAREVHTRLLHEPPDDASAGFAVTRRQLRMRPRLGSKLRYGFRALLAPEPRHLQLLSLPSSLIWLYPLVKLGHDGLGGPLRRMAKAMRVGGREPSAAEPSPATMDAPAYWRSRSRSWARWADSVTASGSELSHALIAPVGVAAGKRVLDLACGVGDTSLILGPRVGLSGVVVSTDLVFEMIRETRRRATAAGVANLHPCVANMEALPFRDRSFDGAVCRLGIMYCPHVERAFSETRRILKDGARAGFLVCGPMADNPLLATVHEVMCDLFDLPRATEPPAPFRFGAPGSLASLMEHAGFVHVEEQELWFGRTTPRQPRFWQPIAERGLGQDIDALPPGTLAELERRLDAALAAHLDGDEYRFVSHMRLALGARAPA